MNESPESEARMQTARLQCDDHSKWEAFLAPKRSTAMTYREHGGKAPRIYYWTIEFLISSVLVFWCSRVIAVNPMDPRSYHVYSLISYRSRVSSGSIMSDYGLDDRAIGVRSSARARDFSSSLYVQTGSGAHPASCTMGTGDPFSWAKARPGRDADH
jgi:hypothetical protein